MRDSQHTESRCQLSGREGVCIWVDWLAICPPRGKPLSLPSTVDPTTPAVASTRMHSWLCVRVCVSSCRVSSHPSRTRLADHACLRSAHPLVDDLDRMVVHQSIGAGRWLLGRPLRQPCSLRVGCSKSLHALAPSMALRQIVARPPVSGHKAASRFDSLALSCSSTSRRLATVCVPLTMPAGRVRPRRRRGTSSSFSSTRGDCCSTTGGSDPPKEQNESQQRP